MSAALEFPVRRILFCTSPACGVAVIRPIRRPMNIQPFEAVPERRLARKSKEECTPSAVNTRSHDRAYRRLARESKAAKTSLRILLLALGLLAVSGCSSIPKIALGKKNPPASAMPSNVRGVFQYSAVSGLASNKMPTRVYLFPPLRSDASGKPVEPLKPVIDADGQITGWRTASGSADALLRIMSKRLGQLGYEVVDFSAVVNAMQPYSVLMVSSFYTPVATLKDVPEGGFDRGQTVMIKASVFDLNLDPKTKVDLLKVDGVLNYASGNPPGSPLDRAFQETMRWFGDNVEGSALLE